MRFTAVIVGRPNVGKSTLFNRLVGRKLALVDDAPGVTRDRREGEASLGHLDFTVVDTAGFEDVKAGALAGRMRAQMEEAIRKSDIVLFVIDARAGVLPMDEKFAKFLRKFDKPVVLIANKAEHKNALDNVSQAHRFGFNEPLALSAEHDLGFSDLLSVLMEYFSEVQAHENEDEEEISAGVEDGPLRLAVIGRPNAGKSTLINTLIGEERLLTGPEPGITRDSIALDWQWRGKSIKLFDTAGIRRRARVQEKLEKLAVSDALRAIRFSHVVALLIDNESPFDKQDLQLADMVLNEGRVLILCINKWDKVENAPARRKELIETAARLLPQVKKLHLITLSGLTGKNVDHLLEAAFLLHESWSRRISTSALNRWFEKASAKNPPPGVAGRRIKLNYVTQVAARPPSFACFGSRPQAVPESYRRYLVNSLCEEFDFESVPVRFFMRGKTNPYAKKASKRG